MKNRKLTIFLVCAIIICAILLLLFFAAPAVLKQRYRLSYLDEIRASSEEFELDITLVCGLIHTESKFNPSAESRAGAIGMMQIMPATGEEIAAALDIEGFETEMLYQPELNIRFGCYYLSMLIERFDGNVYIALAAYNAGPARAREWVDEYGLSEEGRIRYIPYPETDNYVDRVIRAQDVYLMLYEDKLEDD
ncbi:MAG: lytic transglycosylase domain-containing protein [Clostridia bacterium]|nr:lytic transglycosylase domain-containing protein [Clostridia bacterium]